MQTPTPAFDPANGSTDVSITDEIAIKFSDALYDKDKKPITPEYVAEKVVVFKKNSSSGAAVPFDVLISADYKNIVLKPKAALSTNTNYYVAVARATLYNESGKSNTAGSSLFKTSYSNAPDFLPYNGEKNVEVGTTIEITFDRKMYAIGGADLTTAYVRNNVIELYKGRRRRHGCHIQRFTQLRQADHYRKAERQTRRRYRISRCAPARLRLKIRTATKTSGSPRPLRPRKP